MGIALAERSALIPVFDRRSLPAYCIIAAMICVGVSLMLARGFTLTLVAVPSFSLIGLWIFSAGVVRRHGWLRLATWLEANAIVYGQALPSLLILAPSAALFPIADAKLAAIDKALGFDWPAAAYALQPYLKPLFFAYQGFSWQPSVAIALLALFDPKRCWQFVTAGVACLFITSLIFPFFPAYGAFHYHGITPADYPPLTYQSAPWVWMPKFERLREGYDILDASVMGALVSFPSYHAVVGVLTAWAVWPLRWIRYPALLLNAMLIVSALIFGTHHGVDLLAGMALAGAVLFAVTRYAGRSAMVFAHHEAFVESEPPVHAAGS